MAGSAYPNKSVNWICKNRISNLKKCKDIWQTTLGTLELLLRGYSLRNRCHATQSDVPNYTNFWWVRHLHYNKNVVGAFSVIVMSLKPHRILASFGKLMFDRILSWLWINVGMVEGLLYLLRKRYRNLKFGTHCSPYNFRVSPEVKIFQVSCFKCACAFGISGHGKLTSVRRHHIAMSTSKLLYKH